jgi:protein ImuB
LPLPAPVDSVEALGFGVNRLVNDFASWLLMRGLGAVRMSLSLMHERYVRERGTAPTVATFALGAPARAPAHLHAVLRERLARVALPAPVEAIVLTSDETAPLASRNLGLLPEDEAGTVVVPLVERLRSRLGDHAVATLAAQAEHRPEYAASETSPALSQRAPSRMRMAGAQARPSRPRNAKAATRNAKAPAVIGAPRPLWLLDEARPLGVVFEAKPWILRDGPERIESGWWDGRDCRRDYFVAENPQGEIVWIYRDHRYGTDDGEWFLHGLFA